VTRRAAGFNEACCTSVVGPLCPLLLLQSVRHQHRHRVVLSSPVCIRGSNFTQTCALCITLARGLPVVTVCLRCSGSQRAVTRVEFPCVRSCGCVAAMLALFLASRQLRRRPTCVGVCWRARDIVRAFGTAF
jgi:hypothetical protein